MNFARTTEHAPRIPTRATEGAAGYDLPANERVILNPGDRYLARTGWSVQIPEGCVGLIRDRSGLARKGITTRAGVIDADYRGEIMVMLVNESETQWAAYPGDRIAQLLVLSVEMTPSVEVAELDATARGAGGFSSTGV